MNTEAPHEGMRPIEIVGGGLAGLSLGTALRRAGVPVTLFEAQRYPRHRVCGEFIAGLDPATIARLQLAPALDGALRHRRVAWYRDGRLVRTQTLPAPALGLSRHTLDARLAATFVAAGGELRTNARIPLDAAPAGRVFAAGRQRRPSAWLGLKVHARRLTLAADLEVHLGRRAYVGLSPVEGGWVNVCGLFHRQAAGPDAPTPGGPAVILRRLDDAGLNGLAARLREAELDDDSFCAVAGLAFRSQPPPADRIWLGDTLDMTPPFTGNGMAMALQGAAEALDPLLDWALGRRDWPETVATVNRRLWRRFRRRLVTANLLHPFLLESARQCWMALASRARLLPLQPLYHLTH